MDEKKMMWGYDTSTGEMTFIKESIEYMEENYEEWGELRNFNDKRPIIIKKKSKKKVEVENKNECLKRKIGMWLGAKDTRRGANYYVNSESDLVDFLADECGIKEIDNVETK